MIESTFAILSESDEGREKQFLRANCDKVLLPILLIQSSTVFQAASSASAWNDNFWDDRQFGDKPESGFVGLSNQGFSFSSKIFKL